MALVIGLPPAAEAGLRARLPAEMAGTVVGVEMEGGRSDAIVEVMPDWLPGDARPPGRLTFRVAAPPAGYGSRVRFRLARATGFDRPVVPLPFDGDAGEWGNWEWSAATILGDYELLPPDAGFPRRGA